MRYYVPSPKSRFIPLVTLRVVREAGVRYQTSISSPRDAAAEVACQLAGDQDREFFLVLMLNRRHQLTGVQVAGVGTTSAVLVDPWSVFRAAMLTGASAVILAHGHPSGSLTPSPEDISLTRRMIEAGKLLYITVVDHLIVAGDQHISIRELHPQLGWEA